MEKSASSDSRFPIYRITFSWEITLFKASLLFTLISLAVAILFGDFFVEKDKGYGLKIILFLAGASSAVALESLAQPRRRREDRSRLDSLSSNETPSNIYIESSTIASPEKEEDKSGSVRRNDEQKEETSFDSIAQPPPSSIGQSSTMKDVQKVTLYLPPELHRQLKIRSAVELEPMSAVAEQAISFYLANPETIDKIKSGAKEVVTISQLQQVKGSEQESSEQSGSSTQR
jgi:hypothetical protein